MQTHKHTLCSGRDFFRPFRPFHDSLSPYCPDVLPSSYKEFTLLFTVFWCDLVYWIYNFSSVFSTHLNLLFPSAHLDEANTVLERENDTDPVTLTWVHSFLSWPLLISALTWEWVRSKVFTSFSSFPHFVMFKIDLNLFLQWFMYRYQQRRNNLSLGIIIIFFNFNCHKRLKYPIHICVQTLFPPLGLNPAAPDWIHWT